jgi:acyl carrier protein
VAWVVRKPGVEATDSELRAHLRELLPGQLVPRRFVELDELPGGPGGVDRAALPSPFQDEGARTAAGPRTEPERLLATVWQEALSLPRVTVSDNFFDLGGHSLLCLQVVAQIEKRTGKRLSPRSLLLNTLEQLAAQLDGAGGPLSAPPPGGR